MRFKLLNTKKQMSFKIRNKIKKKKFKFLLGDSAIVITRNCNLDYVYFFMFRKLIKKLYKIKNYRNVKQKVWIYLMFNVPITKKSKNSRMGKGKGLLMR
jgi:ribosomal protein L16/L10AE